jgi:superfamily I DNA and RNA helicase
MIDLVVGDKQSLFGADRLIESFQSPPLSSLRGTLYIGYPVIASGDEPVFVDGLLTTLEHSVVVFDLREFHAGEGFEQAKERQDDLYTAIQQKLISTKALRRGRDLAVGLNVVTVSPSLNGPIEDDGFFAAPPDSLPTVLDRFPSIDPHLLEHVNAAIQRVTNIKPARRRANVRSSTSRGAILKSIEKEIANLDQWQKAAAVESPEGPQRIRGLAGSGKTIVLALKAAYLHTKNPDWRIAVTFHTRSLYQQFTDLIRRFTFEHKNDEPDWERLQILHSWGSSSQPGIYSEISGRAGVSPMTLTEARQRFPYEQVFDGICRELDKALSERPIEPFYDAVLIDEAQDLPHSFFSLVWQATTEPKRIVYAYDELQNLGYYRMAPPSELFGFDADKRPRVSALRNDWGQPKQDIVLPVCYRNPPWALTIAHAIGFGIYRKERLVQFFDYPELWKEIGYEILSGEISPAQHVVMKRRASASPQYFRELLDPEDVIVCKAFPDEEAQAEYLAMEIKKNLGEDELEFGDILVILADPLTAKRKAAVVMKALDNSGMSSHVVGVTSGVDSLFEEDSIAISGIHRAKGNEAAMVYVLNSDYAIPGYELLKRRNVLFTAITRSRAWVRLFGCGDGMEVLAKEVESVKKNNYQLSFDIPDADTLKQLRRIHRDRTPEERKTLDKAQASIVDLLELIEKGDVSLETLPPRLREALRKLNDESGQEGE